MSFGSFWEGLKLVKLSKDLKSVAKPEEWHTLARRERDFKILDNDPGNGALEAPFIFKKNGYFNLCRKHISNVPQGVIAHPVYSNYGRIIEKEKQTLLASKNASTTALSATMTKLLEQNNLLLKAEGRIGGGY